MTGILSVLLPKKLKMMPPDRLLTFQHHGNFPIEEDQWLDESLNGWIDEDDWALPAPNWLSRLTSRDNTIPWGL